MTPEQIAAVKLGIEALEAAPTSWRAPEAITALRHILADQALDKMAENARELGLDYEPEQQAKKQWINVECPLCGEMAVAHTHPVLNKPADQVAEPRNMVEQQPADGLESAHIRLQKRYAELEAKVGQPAAWVGLTDEELKELHHIDQFGLFCDADEFCDIARAIEAKLRERNGGKA